MLWKFETRKGDLIVSMKDEMNLKVSDICKLKPGTTDEFIIKIRTLVPQLYFKINKGLAYVTKYFSVKYTLHELRNWMTSYTP